MALLFDGTDDSLQATVDLSAHDKLTVAFWLWWDAYANDNDMCMEHTADEGGVPGGWGFFPNHSSGSWLIGMSGDVGNDVVTFTRPSAAAWHHFAVVLDRSAASHEIVDVYVDGSAASLTYSADLNNTTNFVNSTLNFMSRNNATFFGAGRMAEVAIWPGVLLTAAEAAALAKRFSPLLIRPTSLGFYWPLIGRTSPEIELRSGANATVNGAVFTDHVPMIYPGARQSRGFAATALALAVNADGTLSLGSTLTKEFILSNSFGGSLGLAGAMHKEQTLETEGGLDPLGSLRIESAQAFAGAMTPTGEATLAQEVAFSGSLTPSGGLTFVVDKLLRGTLGLAGTLIKEVSKFFAGTLGLVGGLRAGRQEAPCFLTLFELRTRCYERLDDAAVYYTVAEVNHAINVAQRFFALLTLCNEKTVTFTLTNGQAFYRISDQITDFMVPLKIYHSGTRLKADTIHRLNLRDHTWRARAGNPTRYVQQGLDLFAITPQTPSGSHTLAITYAAVPALLVGDNDVPDIPEDQHEHLPDFAFYFLRLKEGSIELQNATEYLKRFLAQARKYKSYTRSRSRGQLYDVKPLDLATIDLSRFDIKLKKQMERLEAKKEGKVA